MDIKELEKLMIEHGLVIRAIPHEKTSTLSIRHKDRHPNAVVFYDKIRKCEMIKVTEKNPKGGKFFITQKKDQGKTINDWGKPSMTIISYDTIEEAVNSFIK